MNWFPPRRLQTALIFYVAGIILFTNCFFAITTISREKLAYLGDATSNALFLGKTLQEPAFRFLAEGDASRLSAISAARGETNEGILITVYDRDWWRKWGDKERISDLGFPQIRSLQDGLIRQGVDGVTLREIYLPISSGADIIGAIGLGVPDFGTRNTSEAAFQVLLTLGVNVCLGLILAVFIAQIVLRPIYQIVEGLQAIRDGDYGQRLHVLGGNELTMVGETFNMMAASLQEKIRENLERTRALDEKVQELWEIYSLAKDMGFSIDLNEMLKGFLERAVTLSYSSYGQLLLRRGPSGRLEMQVETPSFPRISRDEYEKSLNTCLAKSEAVEFMTAQHTLLALPLVSGRQIHGVLFLAKQGNRAYSEGVRRFLETLAPLGGTMIENAQLYLDVLEMKEYVRNVLDSVDSGVATLDENGMLVTVNAGFMRILGLKPGEKVHAPWIDVVNRAGDPQFSEALSHALDEAIPEKTGGDNESGYESAPWSQIALRRPGHGDCELQVRVNPLIAGQEIIGRVLVIDDVTEMKALERRAFDIEKWAVLGKLAASVAHEIRNPLVAVRSLVEIIGEEVTGESLNHVKVVLGEVHRLNKVVEQLLHFARPERANLCEADLKEVVEELFLLVRHEAGRYGINIVRNWPETPLCATIDREKIKQALLNVMLNSIQSMEQGGTLAVSVRLEADQVVVELLDDGPGIPQEIRKRIFDPFFTTRPNGTGLGLAITKKIVDLHQGSITIDPAPGKGTCVRIELPIRPKLYPATGAPA